MSKAALVRTAKRNARNARHRPPRIWLPFEKTLEVRAGCLCLFVQRAARTLARRFDKAFRRVGLTHGQFSLLMALNRPHPPVMGEVAVLLGMDRTTLTAALKSLQRRGLVEVRADAKDKRSRRLILTPAGGAILAVAYPLWKAAHRAVDALLVAPDRLRADLVHLAVDAEAVAPRRVRRVPIRPRLHSFKKRARNTD
jgi:DNA-binding MarR family transcriptional regulator